MRLLLILSISVFIKVRLYVGDLHTMPMLLQYIHKLCAPSTDLNIQFNYFILGILSKNAIPPLDSLEDSD